MRSDIVLGGTFPDYALPDHTGTVRTLSEPQGRDPLILTLARGNYCPKEHRQHLELAENYPQIAVAYTTMQGHRGDLRREQPALVGRHWLGSGTVVGVAEFAEVHVGATLRCPVKAAGHVVEPLPNARQVVVNHR